MSDNKKTPSQLVNEISMQVGVVAEINKCKDIFLIEMVQQGIITDEQCLAMSAYFVHLVNSASYGQRLWELLKANDKYKNDNATYYAVARATSVPENVKDVIQLLRQQTSAGDAPRISQKKKKRIDKNGKVISLKQWQEKKQGNDVDCDDEGDTNDIA